MDIKPQKPAPAKGGKVQRPAESLVDTNRDEEKFRIGPRKPRLSGERAVNPRLSRQKTSTVFSQLKQRVRVARRIGRMKPGGFPRSRIIVKIKYGLNRANKNGEILQWSRHGSYITRKDAVQKAPGEAAGFDAAGPRADIPATLKRWQDEQDPRIYRIMVSLRAGDDTDLEDLTRRMMKQVEKDLGRPLEWVAAVHTNTDNRHVHIALRGVDRNGEVFRFDKDYIRSRFRQIANHLCPAKAQDLGQRLKYGLKELLTGRGR